MDKNIVLNRYEYWKKLIVIQFGEKQPLRKKNVEERRCFGPPSTSLNQGGIKK